MPTELAKTYDPHEAQQRFLAFWEEHRFFHSEPDTARKPFTIVIPPPNVTGALHLGHALNNTLQDVLIRWRRMQGYNALWIPGTDHAGIATQAVVERLILQTEKKTRHDLGREELVKRIWQWKDKYEARILGQLKQLGASCDWARTRFTLDPICARAVRQTFFDLFKAGLIFRGKRLVNWDAHLQTSVADDETYTEDTKGNFWTFKYPVKSPNLKPAGEQREPAGLVYISFSTTRPETMLGDTAICVHPSDERYQHLIGQSVTIPLVNRDIPIIADALLANPALGTGCVKVTPAHDPNDYACYQRNPHIGIINILNPDGTINEAGGKYKGLDRYKAREAVVADMEALGLFEGKEERVIPLKYSDRSKTPIEPYLSDQWFVKMGEASLPRKRGEEDESREATGTPPANAGGSPGLAQMAMDAVKDGRVKFHPARYADTYLDWLGEKRDWCISRQLWWGHRIPVWSKTCANSEEFDELMVQWLDGWVNSLGQIAFATDPNPLTIHICFRDEQHEYMALLEQRGFRQDPDVLDTWFSSMLWPHSTLGWPEPTPELKYYYPTSVLVTSRDIITLWVARMVIAGLFNCKQIPFPHVYIHPKLLDGFGETMSKGKGNGVDPLDIIDLYGTDALRFAMVDVSTETQDSRIPVANICPHCNHPLPVKQEHMYMRTKKVTCTECKKPFRPGGPWPADDAELKTAKQGSERFEKGRNFANKIWNAARFILLNLDGYAPQPLRIDELPLEDRWILSRLTSTAADVTASLEGYHFSESARAIYEFVWSEFCDWFIEMDKGRLTAGGDAASRAVVQRVLVGALDGIVRLVHPIMPFVAESLWQALGDAAKVRGLPNPMSAVASVSIAPWPVYPPAWKDAALEKRMARMQELVRAVREVRNRYQVDPKTALEVNVRCSPAVAADFTQLTPFIQMLAGVGRLRAAPDVTKPPQSASHVDAEFEVYVSLQGLIDVAAEVKRIEKDLVAKRKYLQSMQAKLDNPSFRDKAPADVVQQMREQVTDTQKQIAILEENLAELVKG